MINDYMYGCSGLYDSCSGDLLSQTAFYGPAMSLMSQLSDWKTVLGTALTKIKATCKPYYNDKVRRSFWVIIEDFVGRKLQSLRTKNIYDVDQRLDGRKMLLPQFDTSKIINNKNIKYI